jgi:hypothetical protein
MNVKIHPSILDVASCFQGLEDNMFYRILDMIQELLYIAFSSNT